MLRLTITKKIKIPEGITEKITGAFIGSLAGGLVGGFVSSNIQHLYLNGLNPHYRYHNICECSNGLTKAQRELGRVFSVVSNEKEFVAKQFENLGIVLAFCNDVDFHVSALDSRLVDEDVLKDMRTMILGLKFCIVKFIGIMKEKETPSTEALKSLDYIYQILRWVYLSEDLFCVILIGYAKKENIQEHKEAWKALSERFKANADEVEKLRREFNGLYDTKLEGMNEDKIYKILLDNLTPKPRMGWLRWIGRGLEPYDDMFW